MISKSRAAELVALLERVARGETIADQALAEWPDTEKEDDPLLERARHNLAHFANDEDIRHRDATYADYQRRVLLDDADTIRASYGIRAGDDRHAV